jgi:hypothetical protein
MSWMKDESFRIDNNIKYEFSHEKRIRICISYTVCPMVCIIRNTLYDMFKAQSYVLFHII